MIHEQIATGTTVDAAFDEALRLLNAPADAEVKKEILEMPVKKTFGLFGGAPAKVKVSYEESAANTALSYFKNILKHMGFGDAHVTAEETEQGIEINVECEDYGVLIGRRGETLDAIQYLTGLVANRVGENYYRVSINAGNYREKRSRTLESLAIRTATQVQRSGKSVTLDPMNPYERRIIHTAVQKVKGTTSQSVGEENNRCVVISLAEGFKPLGDNRGYRGKSGGYRGNNNRSGDFKGRSGPYNRDNSRPYNNNRPRPNNYQNNRPQQGGDAPVKPQTEAAKPQEQKKDHGSAPLYGRIDK